MSAARTYLRDNWLALACLLIGIALIWSQLQYPTHWLNEWDESQLINSGRELANGKLPVYALSPLLAFFYLPFYLVFKNNPLWLFEAATWGHRVLLISLWGVLWLIAKEIFQKQERAALLVWPIVTAAFAGIVSNSSDAAFAIMSGLAFWQMLRFRTSESYLNVAWAGIFLGLACLCRPDGLLLTVIGAISVVGILYRLDELHKGPSMLGTLLLPVFLIAFLDLGMQHRMMGQSQLGIRPHTYVAFEQGQGVVYSDRFKDQNPLRAGQKWSEQLYGPASKNGDSILRAVAKNPRAFSARLSRQLKQAPAQAIEAFSDANKNENNSLPITGAAFMFAVFAGVIYLVKQKQKGLVLMCLGWTSFLAIYMVTFYRPGYFLAVCFPLFVLAAFSLVWVVRVIQEYFQNASMGQGVVAIPALTLGLVAGTTRGIPSPRTYRVTEGDVYQAVYAIKRASNSGAVVSSAPQLAFDAQKEWIDPTEAPLRADHFKNWAQKKAARAMVVDGRMQYDDPDLYTSLSKNAGQIGKPLTDSEDIKVYKISDQPATPAAKPSKHHLHRHRRHKKRKNRRH